MVVKMQLHNSLNVFFTIKLVAVLPTGQLSRCPKHANCYSTVHQVLNADSTKLTLSDKPSDVTCM